MFSFAGLSQRLAGQIHRPTLLLSRSRPTAYRLHPRHEVEAPAFHESTVKTKMAGASSLEHASGPENPCTKLRNLGAADTVHDHMSFCHARRLDPTSCHECCKQQANRFSANYITPCEQQPHQRANEPATPFLGMSFGIRNSSSEIFGAAAVVSRDD